MRPRVSLRALEIQSWKHPRSVMGVGAGIKGERHLFRRSRSFTDTSYASTIVLASRESMLLVAEPIVANWHDHVCKAKVEVCTNLNGIADG